MTPAAPDRAQLIRTAQRIVRGIWVCAGLTMAGSALTGALTFASLHEFWGVGLATALAVDVALWVVLTGDHQLQALGLSSGVWGRAMRIGTAAMSGTLNCGFSLMEGQIFLAVLHVFLPLILIGLTEYHQTVGLAIHRALPPEHAAYPVVATAMVGESLPAATHPIEGISEKSEGQTARRHIEDRTELQRRLQPSAEPTTQTPLRLVSAGSVKPRRAVSGAAPVTGQRAPVKATAVRWLRAQQRKGVPLSSITAQQLADGAQLKIDTCRRNLASWRAEVADVREVAR